MIRYTAFCKVVELGSFTRAAETLGYTQAAISQMIRSLEEELGLTLLHRSHGGIRMTPEGEMMYPYIQRTVSCLRAMGDKAKEIGDLDEGEIRIGTISSISQHWLPILIKRFVTLYPNVRFHLYQSNISLMRDWLRTGYIDFCFVYQEAIPGFRNTMLARDSFMAVLPKEHPLSPLPSLSLQTIAEMPLIYADEGDISAVLSAFQSQNLTPHIQYKVHDDYTILAMVEQGLGISILPAMVLDRTNYQFVAIPTNPVITRRIGIAYREPELLPIATQRFLTFLQEHLEECITGQYTYLAGEK